MTQKQSVSCLIIAGEMSGEEHLMSFFPQLKENLAKQSCAVDFYGVGGDTMNALGVDLLFHLKDFSAMGFVEVIEKLFFFLSAERRILNEVEKRKTKAAILVDFQEFNYNLAKKLKKRGVEVFYYVAPQAWAWRGYRGKVLAKNIHTLFCILPFEKKFFHEKGVKNVIGVPHPLLKKCEKFLPQIETSIKKNLPWRILLLPGSRKLEVENLLITFIKAIQRLRKNYPIHVSLVKADSIDESYFNQPEIQKMVDQFYSSHQLEEAMLNSHFCFAASGTVTLQTAIFALPTIVCYKVSLISAFIYREFVGYQGYISLANIIHQKMLFPELLQEKADEFEIEKIASLWINNPEVLDSLRTQLLKTSSYLLGDQTNVSDIIAPVLRKISSLPL